MITKHLPLIFVLLIGLQLSACAQKSGSMVQDLTAEAFQTKWENATEDALLVDVRTPGEYEAGFIPEAVNWNVNDANFLSHFKQIPKDRPVYVYCRSGGRSSRAASILLDYGFQEVYNLKGGFMNWPYKVEK